ncbi:MAG: hypothetical protein K0S12_2031 [Bacteroidetes bacterium]|nr:hypothetical protein [Bacteroidota bacterium]
MKKIILLGFILLTVAPGCNKKERDIRKAENVTASNFLSSEKYTSLRVELVYDQGFPPTPETTTAIQNFLSTYLNKPAGISIITRELKQSPKLYMNLQDIAEQEGKHRTAYPDGSSLACYVYLANSEYLEGSESKTLGIQYAGSSVILFGKTMRNYSGGLAQPPYKTLETSVALHEFGHLLGLVNTGSAMVTDHQDAPHGHHCINTNCLMYYAVETSDIVSNLLGGSVPPLDANCVNDLKANGGK